MPCFPSLVIAPKIRCQKNVDLDDNEHGRKTSRWDTGIAAPAKAGKGLAQQNRRGPCCDPVMERILSSKAYSVAFLVKAGILNKSGTRLSKPYR